MSNTGDTTRSSPPYKPVIFVLSGPSGVGKDAVLNSLKEAFPAMKYIVTMTTRPRREKEVQDRDYNFVSEAEFKELIERNGLLEFANVYGNFYGVPANDVEEALAQGTDVMVKVDIQGVENIRKKKPDAVTIFLAPPSLEELFNRLKQRKTESDSSLQIRMRTAEKELKTANKFDYIVINAHGEIEKAVSDIEAIITAEKLRVK